MNCPKCSSTFLQIQYGYSQEDERGTLYQYVHCIMCGCVRHVLSEAEERAQVFERIRLLPNELHVTKQSIPRH
jgi:hypothetical protein